jgi:uncharacterized protein
VIKLLVREQDSDLAAELWAAATTRVASHLMYAEARAALAAAARARRLEQAELESAIVDLDRALESVHLVGVDGALARTAGALAEELGLRGYDAVHLATALAVDAPDLVVVTWDRALSVASRARGCSVAPADV